MKRNVKYIINYMFLGIAVIATTSSCSDDFLEKSPKNTVDTNTKIDDQVAIAMTNACYRTLQSSNMYNQRLWTLDIVAGNSEVGAGGGTDGLETVQASNFTTLSDNGMALYMWRSPWVGIGQCNTLIKSIETQVTSPAVFKNVALAKHFSCAHIIITFLYAYMAVYHCA